MDFLLSDIMALSCHSNHSECFKYLKRKDWCISLFHCRIYMVLAHLILHSNYKNLLATEKWRSNVWLWAITCFFLRNSIKVIRSCIPVTFPCVYMHTHYLVSSFALTVNLQDLVTQNVLKKQCKPILRFE